MNDDSAEKKLFSLAEVGERVRAAKASGKKIVHCHGLFEILHPGLTRLLTDAKAYGDVLVVTIIEDQKVDVDPARPIFSQRLRAEALTAMHVVDFVAIDDSASATERIKMLQPDVVVRIEEQFASPGRESFYVSQEDAALREIGGEVRYAKQPELRASPRGVTPFGALAPEGLAYVEEFRTKYSCDEILSLIDKFKGLKVLVIGDAIVDEYHFCSPFGMASKSFAIASRFLSAESYAGGSLAIANHVAGFCDRVTLLTCLGSQDSQEEFIRDRLKKNVDAKFVYRDDAPTVTKRRYVNQGGGTKLFEVSFFNDSLITGRTVKDTVEFLESSLKDYDLVLLADFGHGFMTPEVLKVICEKAPYLAVNTQLNSINLGFNVITKMPRCDYACIDQAEVRMACRDRHSPIDELVRELVEELNCPLMTVTRGPVGAVTYSTSQGFASAPVFCRDVLDSTGAGDAFLSLASPSAKSGFKPDLICFIGNAAGAIAVRTIGNRTSVAPDTLFRFIRDLLW